MVDNFLVFKFWAGEQLAYMMPVGTGDLKAVLWELIEDARKENQHFCMLGDVYKRQGLLYSAHAGRLSGYYD